MWINFDVWAAVAALLYSPQAVRHFSSSSFKDAKTCLGVNAKHSIRLRDIIHEMIKKNDTLKMEHIGLSK